MGLMVEEVRHQESARIAQLLLGRLAEPHQVLRQPRLVDPEGMTEQVRHIMNRQGQQAQRDDETDIDQVEFPGGRR